VTPPNLTEAESITPGLNPVFADSAELAVEIETPSGAVLAVDDPALVRMLGERIGDGQALTLIRSERAMTDCCPLSLFSVQTGQQLAEEIGFALDKRRFRANIYMNLDEATSGGYAKIPRFHQGQEQQQVPLNRPDICMQSFILCSSP
jgi:hypothetical protein